MARVTKAELEYELSQARKRLSDIEQELHEANNSVDYWSTEYNSLLKEYNSLKDTLAENDIQPVSIIDEFKMVILMKMYRHSSLEDLQSLELKMGLATKQGPAK